MLGYTTGNLDSVINNYGLTPAAVLHTPSLSAFATLFTSMFLHADLLHLGGNMLFLYVFGDNVEDTFGHVGFLLFYFVAGLLASFAHVGSLLYFMDAQGLQTVTIGASGAISGVLGAYLILYPTARILTLVFLGWVWIVPIPAVVFLGIWFGFQFLYGTLLPLAGGVAYWAHIGGFISGLFFGVALRGRRRKRAL
jgi:membrane associated rhomboid family serine protease